jgi:hypothetical protein
MTTGDWDRIQSEQEQNERRLDALRAVIADREHREQAARQAQAAAERESFRQYQQQCRDAVAAKAAQTERARRMIGYATLEDTRAALCDALDRIAALEAALNRQEPRS